MASESAPNTFNACSNSLTYIFRYQITAWSGRSKDKEWVFDIEFTREIQQASWTRVSYHPVAEEIDDYLEYRRCREQHEQSLLLSQNTEGGKRTTPKTSKSKNQPLIPQQEEGSPGTLGPKRLSSTSVPRFQDLEMPSLHGREPARKESPRNEADQEELNEMRFFEFPSKPDGMLTKAKQMPPLFSAERL